jgi:hypothetical protein
VTRTGTSERLAGHADSMYGPSQMGDYGACQMTIRIELADMRGRFERMREDVLAVIGSSFYYDTPTWLYFVILPII